MKNKFLGLLLAALLVCCAAGVTQAAIVIDFDTAPLTPDTSAGDHNHILPTAYGNITFNGRIWDKLDGASFADNTTGSGYFLKNTDAKAKVTMTFDFDVAAIDFYWAGLGSGSISGALYDITGAEIDGGSESVDGTWNLVNVPPRWIQVAGPAGSGPGSHRAVRPPDADVTSGDQAPGLQLPSVASAPPICG